MPGLRNATPDPIPLHAIPSGLVELEFFSAAWNGVAWSGAVELEVDWNCHPALELEWSGVGHLSGQSS